MAHRFTRQLYVSHHTPHFQQKKNMFWVFKNILAQISVISNHMALGRTPASAKLLQQVCTSVNGRLWLENKKISYKLVSKETNYDDHLPKLITEHSVWGQFILSGTNGLRSGKLFFILFSGGCFTELATYFKSYWKHWTRWKQTRSSMQVGHIIPTPKEIKHKHQTR